MHWVANWLQRSYFAARGAVKRRLCSPYKMRDPVMLVSIPKCGTHMVRNVLHTLPGFTAGGFDLAGIERCESASEALLLLRRVSDVQPGRVYWGHIPYSPEAAAWLKRWHFKVLFLSRDPRDMLISAVHYIMKRRDDLPYYGMFSTLPNDEARLMAMIEGVGEGQRQFKMRADSMPNVRLFYDAFSGWRRERDVLSLRYEDFLRGPGGDDRRIKETLGRILSFLEIPCCEALMDHLIDTGMDPSSSPTFRKGGSGGWRSTLSQEHLEAFRRVGGNLLAAWDYPDSPLEGSSD